MELGPMGMAPWGTVEKATAEPDVFCDFSIVSDLLASGRLAGLRVGRPGALHAPAHEGGGHILCRQPRRPSGGSKLHVPGIRQSPGAVGPVDRARRATCRNSPRAMGVRPCRCALSQRSRSSSYSARLWPKGKRQGGGQREDGEFLPVPMVPFPSPQPSPLGRGSMPAVRFGEAGRAGMGENRRVRLPLPRGEGRGEGELASESRKDAPSATGFRNFPATTRLAELPGPWNVSFDPKWGGPENVTFDTLQDWSKRKEDGIRFYSGTANYRKTFDAARSPWWPTHLFGPGDGEEPGPCSAQRPGPGRGLVRSLAGGHYRRCEGSG